MEYDIRGGSAIIFKSNGEVIKTFSIEDFESYEDMQATCLTEFSKLTRNTK